MEERNGEKERERERKKETKKEKEKKRERDNWKTEITLTHEQIFKPKAQMTHSENKSIIQLHPPKV